MVRSILFTFLLFLVFCGTRQRTDWNMIISGPPSTSNTSIKTHPYEFEDENIFVSIGPYLGIKYRRISEDSDPFHFIVHNKSKKQIVIDFDEATFISENGYAERLDTVFTVSRADKDIVDTLPINLPPKSQYHTMLFTSYSPSREMAKKKLYQNQAAYFKDVRIAIPLKLGEQKKTYVFDIMLYFREDEKIYDDFEDKETPLPFFLLTKPKHN